MSQLQNGKILILGPVNGGKKRVVAALKDQMADCRFEDFQIGDTQVAKSECGFDVFAEKEVKGKLEIHSILGTCDYNAVQELLLKNVDGVLFVVSAEDKNTAHAVDSFQLLSFSLKRAERSLSEVPHAVQYVRADADQEMVNVGPIDEVAGLDEQSANRFVTKADKILDPLRSLVSEVIQSKAQQ